MNTVSTDFQPFNGNTDLPDVHMWVCAARCCFQIERKPSGLSFLLPWHLSNVSSKWSFADSFIYTLRFACSLSLSPRICPCYHLTYFSLYFIPAVNYLLWGQLVSYRNPNLCPLVSTSLSKILKAYPQKRTCETTFFFNPAVIIIWLIKAKMTNVFCSHLVRPHMTVLHVFIIYY